MRSRARGASFICCTYAVFIPTRTHTITSKLKYEILGSYPDAMSLEQWLNPNYVGPQGDKGVQCKKKKQNEEEEEE